MGVGPPFPAVCQQGSSLLSRILNRMFAEREMTMTKIVIAPDSFKGSASAAEIAGFIAAGARRARPDLDCRLLPVSDGGEGFCEAMAGALACERRYQRVTGPDGRPRDACWLYLPDGRAVLELAQAAGLTAMNGHLDAGGATSYGVGELLRAALDAGCREIILGLGGSACTDGGAGMLQALGLSLRDAAGRELPYGGLALASLAELDCSGLDPRLADCRILLACDVTNPLTGAQGSAAVFGPQKGADDALVQQLDAALAHFAALTACNIGCDLAASAGAGAAGGVAFGLLAYGHAELRRGIDLLLDTVSFEQMLQGVSLLIVGEGRIDRSTAYGKAPIGLAQRARRCQPALPVVALCGSVGPGAEMVLSSGIDAIFPFDTANMPLEQAMREVRPLAEAAAERLIHCCFPTAESNACGMA